MLPSKRNLPFDLHAHASRRLLALQPALCRHTGWLPCWLGMCRRVGFRLENITGTTPGDGKETVKPFIQVCGCRSGARTADLPRLANTRRFPPKSATEADMRRQNHPWRMASMIKAIDASRTAVLHRHFGGADAGPGLSHGTCQADSVRQQPQGVLHRGHAGSQPKPPKSGGNSRPVGAVITVNYFTLVRPGADINPAIVCICAVSSLPANNKSLNGPSADAKW